MNSVIVDSGITAIAGIISGAISGRPNAMYVEFCNGTPEEPVIANDRDISYYNALSAPYGFVRVGLSGLYLPPENAGVITATACVTEAVMAAQHPAIVDLTGIKFYAAGLVYAPDWANPANDILMSASNFMASGVFAPVTFIPATALVASLSLAIGR